MATLLTPSRRRGEVIHELTAVPDLQTQIEISMPLSSSGLGVTPVSLRVKVEQTTDGVAWFTLGGMTIADVRLFLESRDKLGALYTHGWLRVTEQIVRHDVYQGRNWAEAYELKNDADGAWYHQLALTTRLRFRMVAFTPTPEGDIQDFANLTYGLDAEIRRTEQPPTPIGRRSASLLGTFGAAEASATSVSSGSRTSTTGSLVIGQGSTWNGSDVGALAITDDKSNAYTEHLQDTVSSGAGSFGEFVLSSNNGGTRGLSHEVICTTNVNIVTVGGLEFDGVEASPTVDVGTLASGTGTAASCSVTPTGGAALVVGIMAYDGSGTTFAVNAGTLGLEVDENNDRQANGTNYIVNATGATTTSWTIALSRAWAARSVAWTEVAAGGSTWGPLLGGQNNRLVQA